MFHVIRMKTGWESGAVTVVFFFLPFSFVYEYLRKKVGLFSRLLLPVMGLDNGLQLPERTGHPLLCISGAQPVYSCYDN